MFDVDIHEEMRNNQVIIEPQSENFVYAISRNSGWFKSKSGRRRRRENDTYSVKNFCFHALLHIFKKFFKSWSKDPTYSWSNLTTDLAKKSTG